ncbi:MAG: hypothetical protein D6823_15240 [Chloroflexi bacterium]|nr:MAG: hypothetical protein D6823_15240 [Chloroflexota bacterium]
MKNRHLLDRYSDDLISAFGQPTATGLTALLNGAVGHDHVQRFLAQEEQPSADVWRMVKPHARQMQSADGVMMVDDSIAEKPSTDENAMICWHADHAQHRSSTGINVVTWFYHRQGVSLPVGFELVRQMQRSSDPKDGKEKRRSDKTNNDIDRDVLAQAVKNQIPFRYVLSDIWVASAEPMNVVANTPSNRSSLCHSTAIATWPCVWKPGSRDGISEWNAGTGTDATCHRVGGRCGLSTPAHHTRLHNRRRFDQHPLSSDRRYHLGWERDCRNLSKTMERGTLSHVAHIACLLGNVTYPNGDHTNHCFAALCETNVVPHDHCCLLSV